jgi:RNA polymerase sigma-70 factor (ECF subfamily)
MTELPAQPRIFGSVGGAFPTRDRQEAAVTHDLRALFESERDGLFRFLWRLSGNATDAEDLLQETFLTAWRKRERFERSEHVAGYLRRTAFRLFLNARRKSDRRAALTSREEEPEAASACDAAAESDARKNLLRRVRTAIAALPDGTREAFLLFRYEELTCAEIATVMDVSVDAIEGRIERAMKTLATRLRPHAEDLPEL